MPESASVALDGKEYPGDQFRDLSELGVDVDDGGEEAVGIDAVDVEEGGGANLADVALDGGWGDLDDRALDRVTALTVFSYLCIKYVTSLFCILKIHT